MTTGFIALIFVMIIGACALANVRINKDESYMELNDLMKDVNAAIERDIEKDKKYEAVVAELEAAQNEIEKLKQSSSDARHALHANASFSQEQMFECIANAFEILERGES